MKFQIGIIVFILLSGVFYSCKKENVYPIEPAISMSPDQIYLSPATITISFTDGDGDVGLSDADTVPPYNLDPVNFNKYYYHLLHKYIQSHLTFWRSVQVYK